MSQNNYNLPKLQLKNIGQRTRNAQRRTTNSITIPEQQLSTINNLPVSKDKSYCPQKSNSSQNLEIN